VTQNGIDNDRTRGCEPIAVLTEHMLDFATSEADRFGLVGMQGRIHHAFIIPRWRDSVSHNSEPPPFPGDRRSVACQR